MHAEAYDWIKACRKNIKVAELGSRNVNGSVRDLFPDADYTGVDMAGTKAEGVDIQADAKTWDGGRKRYDIVVTTEALEHEEQWREILATAHRILKPGGYLFVTCAGTGRESHSVDGGPRRLDEHAEAQRRVHQPLAVVQPYYAAPIVQRQVIRQAYVQPVIQQQVIKQAYVAPVQRQVIRQRIVQPRVQRQVIRTRNVQAISAY